MLFTVFLFTTLLLAEVTSPAAACSRYTRILGGRDATDGEFPFVVSLQVKREGYWEHFCSGAVLDERHILTAGHCLCEFNVENEKWQVVAGTRDLYNTAAPKRVTRTVEQYYFHDEYSFSQGSHDIAILRLTRRFPPKNPYIGSIPLASTTPGPLTGCTVSGWGVKYYPNDKPVSPDIMQTLNYPLIDHKNCSETFKKGFVYAFDETMMCTGWDDKKVCNSDTGNAVVCDGKLSGLVCWGFECTLAEYPSVSTDIAQHQKWIAETLKQSAKDAAVVKGKVPFIATLNKKTCVKPTVRKGVLPVLKSQIDVA